MIRSQTKFLGIRSQQGAALLIMFLALFMVSAAVMLKGLKGGNLALQQEAAAIKMLASAREDLLASVVADGNPGHFPCPDVNNDGTADATCGVNALGRLPSEFNRAFSTDQQLWYALTDAYRKSPNPSGTPAAGVNSSTAGGLSLDGRGDLVAILIAPGPVLTGQSRPGTLSDNYLETGPTGGSVYAACSGSASCNDRLVTISRPDIMPLITSRAASEIGKKLDNYHVTYGEYPVDQAAFLTAIAGIETWVTTNQWPGITTYTRASMNSATLQFTDCAIIFTLTFGADALARSRTTCQ